MESHPIFPGRRRICGVFLIYQTTHKDIYSGISAGTLKTVQMGVRRALALCHRQAGIFEPEKIRIIGGRDGCAIGERRSRNHAVD